MFNDNQKKQFQIPFEFRYNSSGSTASLGAFGFLVHLTLSSNSMTVFQCASSSPTYKEFSFGGLK